MSKKKIYRAGFIPYIIEKDEIKILFMKPSDPKFGGDVWQIAKGKVDPGETPEQAAVREAQEELGLFKPNIDGNKKHLGQFLGRTDIYVGKMKDKDMFGDFMHETASTKWMSPKEFYSDGREIHKPIIRAAERHIKKKEKIDA